VADAGKAGIGTAVVGTDVRLRASRGIRTPLWSKLE
jgi:hypothetical protein